MSIDVALDRVRADMRSWLPFFFFGMSGETHVTRHVMHRHPCAGKERVEVYLAMGATRMEATRHVRRRAMMVALQPVLNQMSVVGIVSIPGVNSVSVVRHCNTHGYVQA